MFVFVWGMYGLGAISPQKTQILAIAMPSTTLHVEAPRRNYFCHCLLGITAVAIAHSLFLFKIAVHNSA